MPNHRDEEKRGQIIKYYEDGYLQSQIGRMVGITKQRVNAIVKDYKRTGGIKQDMTDYQLRKVGTVIFPNISKYLVKEHIQLVTFCKAVNSGTSQYAKAKRFLTGESDNTSIEMISNILKETGMSFEEAFGEERNDETDCVK